MQFKNHYNAIPDLGEVNTAPSQTIPGQSLSVKQIMTRYAQGLGWDGPKVGTYDNGEDPLNGINLENLDLSERASILEQVNERVTQLRHDMAEELKKRPKPLTPDEIDRIRRANDSQAPQATMQPLENNEQAAQLDESKPKKGKQ